MAKKTVLVRLSAREVVHYMKVVEMPAEKLAKLRKLYEARDDKGIDTFVDCWLDKISDFDDGEGIEDTEVEIVERTGPKGKLMVVENLYFD